MENHTYKANPDINCKYNPELLSDEVNQGRQTAIPVQKLLSNKLDTHPEFVCLLSSVICDQDHEQGKLVVLSTIEVMSNGG